MRNTLTNKERWELGVFLGLLVVGCLVLVGFVQLRQLPALNASKDEKTEPILFNSPQSNQILAQIDPPAPSLTDFLQIPEVPQQVATVPPLLPLRKAPSPAPVEMKKYAGEDYRFVKTLHLRVTAYAADIRCTYPYPGTTTASGLPSKTNGGRLVAADPSIIAMHSLVSVPGYAGTAAVPVLDKGGAIKGYRLDVLLPSYAAAQKWGSRMLDVKVYAPVK